MSEVNTKKPITPFRAFVDKLVFTLYVIALILAVCFSAFIWFQKTYFSAYWVNGQSMWPTLNADAKDANGILFNEEKRALDGATGVDFVIGDCHQNAIDSIKRFDIVVCKYSDSDYSDKIKRVIVLPGETFYIDTTGAGNEGNGVLHILNSSTNDYEIIDQSFTNISAGDYPVIYSQPTTLNENEYFVMGDNRANSSDSRQNGPITKSNIEAKTIALVAKCKIVYNVSEGKYVPTDVNYSWPRFF